ncbi:MAG TPA: pyrimidine/purine nucleoside phosphorylase, partial [Rhodocyclaceae bacterium]
MSQFDSVSVFKKANVYFDGKCVSHTVQFADGIKKSVGVILPATLTFNTGVPEIMEGVAGSCRVRLKNETEWKAYG